MDILLIAFGTLLPISDVDVDAAEHQLEPTCQFAQPPVFEFRIDAQSSLD